MKNLFLIPLFIFIALNLNAQESDQACHFGITFEISNNPHWGYGEPVVLTVEPNSPADVAGIRSGDIIMEINGEATYLRNYQTIYSWLFDNSSDMASFTIRNLSSYFKQIELPRRCRPVNCLDESNIASSFNMYSLENTQDRAFTLPLTITTNKDTDYSDYHTFDFLQEENAPEVDKYIYAQLEKVLVEKGMVRAKSEPDMIIQTYYKYYPNSNYNPHRSSAAVKTSWRYDMESKKMVLLPTLPGEGVNKESEGQFILEFGLRFFDKKLIDPENLTQIWEANVKEYLSAQYNLDQYTKLHLPLIMMQFPYSQDRSSVSYTVNFRRYNYMGVCYDIDNMSIVRSVDYNSPAYKAGVRAGMVVDKINGVKFEGSRNDILDGYKRFIVETMEYRDPSTRFIDANGYPDCMYWSRKHYGDLTKAFKQKRFYPIFSYLYSFEKYVSDNSGQSISFETKKVKYNIVPEIKDEITVRAF